MLGRLRVLLITGLVVLPVTADLHHGFRWSVASAQKTYSAPFVLPLYYLYPWCTSGKFKYYDASGKLYGSGSWHDPIEGTWGFNCAQAMCRRKDWCISEARNGPYPYYTPTKITYDCVEEICIAVRPFRSPR
jgi:hypothetical protein